MVRSRRFSILILLSLAIVVLSQPGPGGNNNDITTIEFPFEEDTITADGEYTYFRVRDFDHDFPLGVKILVSGRAEALTFIKGIYTSSREDSNYEHPREDRNDDKTEHEIESFEVEHEQILNSDPGTFYFSVRILGEAGEFDMEIVLDTNPYDKDGDALKIALIVVGSTIGAVICFIFLSFCYILTRKRPANFAAQNRAGGMPAGQASRDIMLHILQSQQQNQRGNAAGNAGQNPEQAFAEDFRRLIETIRNDTQRRQGNAGGRQTALERFLELMMEAEQMNAQLRNRLQGNQAQDQARINRLEKMLQEEIEKFPEEKKEEEKEETGPEGVMPQILHQNSGIDDKMCVICYDNTKSVGFLPCKHMCCCKTCALGLVKKAPKCPLCRADIQNLEFKH